MLCSLAVHPRVVCSPLRVRGQDDTSWFPHKFLVIFFIYEAGPPPFHPHTHDRPPLPTQHADALAIEVLSPSPRNPLPQLSPSCVFSLSLACAILTIFLLTCHSGIRAITMVPHWPAASLRKEKKSSIPLFLSQ